MHLMKKLGSLGIHILKGPTGRYFLRGSNLPVAACYERKDGAPLTTDDIAAITQCGPGFARACRARTFATEAEALEAVK